MFQGFQQQCSWDPGQYKTLSDYGVAYGIWKDTNALPSMYMHIAYVTRGQMEQYNNSISKEHIYIVCLCDCGLPQGIGQLQGYKNNI